MSDSNKQTNEIRKSIKSRDHKVNKVDETEREIQTQGGKGEQGK